MVSQAIWIGIVIGVFFAGLGIGYAVFQPSLPSFMPMTTQQMHQTMNNPQAMNSWMNTMVQNPQQMNRWMLRIPTLPLPIIEINLILLEFEEFVGMEEKLKG